ncbi:hypothetical protein JAAARDRAFT_420701 [Jaapia argillacea MUCL 33604]|uniref:Uncharacterized protein n=1 Tax=Jaapia argillacea MUCL 33604 TaxID=933084 RepID=A0A067PFW4_9AGAM|nr:hypothetical protein JAAARDRAFT_420701 [Jaapia argillacea MUCL 33604]
MPDMPRHCPSPIYQQRSTFSCVVSLLRSGRGDPVLRQRWLSTHHGLSFKSLSYSRSLYVNCETPYFISPPYSMLDDSGCLSCIGNCIVFQAVWIQGGEVLPRVYVLFDVENFDIGLALVIIRILS